MTAPDPPADELLARALEALPLFPLSGTVFFPHTLLPLHVFEPRYRQMTEDVLAGHQHMAVVLARPAETVPGQPCAIAEVAGLGRVVHHERLADGRFHILLQGVGRAALHGEVVPGDRLYRRARATLLATPDTQDAGEQAELATLRGCYTRLVDAFPDCKDTLGDLPLRIKEASVLADIVCAAVLEDTAARQQALEELSVSRRLRCANEALATLLLKSLQTGGEGVH